MDSAEGKVGGVLVLKGRRGERSQVTLQAEAARGLGGCLLPVSRRGCWQALFRLALEAGGPRDSAHTRSKRTVSPAAAS